MRTKAFASIKESLRRVFNLLDEGILGELLGTDNVNEKYRYFAVFLLFSRSRLE